MSMRTTGMGRRSVGEPPPNYLPTTPVTCCACRIVFAVSDNWHAARIRDHGTFYCPNGHPQHFGGPYSNYKQIPGVYARKKA